MTDDGQLVAVERQSAQGPGVWLIDIRRGVETKIDTRNESIASPVLSSDGLRVTCLTRQDDRPVIVERPIRGGARRVLFDYPAGEGAVGVATRRTGAQL